MVYLDDAGRRQPVQTAADWAIRRRQILAGMQQAMGPLPKLDPQTPLDPRETERLEEGGVVRIKLSFASADNTGDRVTAHLYLPAGLKPGERARPCWRCTRPERRAKTSSPVWAGRIEAMAWSLPSAATWCWRPITLRSAN